MLGATMLLPTANYASAQIIIGGAGGAKLPKLDGVPPELQKQLEEAFQRAGAGQGGGFRGGWAGMSWGGLRLEKPAAELQTQLGLEANEGLVVASVDPNSVGAKAGVMASDVLVKIGDKSVPNDHSAFIKLVKDQKENEPMDLVVVRKGKQETLKGAKMPALVQNVGGRGGNGGFGGFGGRPPIGFPRIQINPGGLPINPFLGGGKLDKLHLEMTVNGAKLVKDQDGDKFSGSYTKGELKITVAGTTENLQNKISEITVQEGKEAKKYANLQDVPAQHRAAVQQLLPSPLAGMMMLPFPNLDELQGLIPPLDE
jgi:hypothetical protein